MDVISITHHREAPRELLRRRFSALVGDGVDGLAADVELEAPRRALGAGEGIFGADDPQPKIWLLASGVAGDVRVLADGRRQVLSLRLPGDVLQGDAQEAVVALSPVEVVDAHPLIRALGDRSPEHQPLRQAWVAAARLEQALIRDHVVRLGCLSAHERMAHFLMETHDRLSQVGLAAAASLHLPIKQDVIADLMGLSVVHVSRTMQVLKRDGLAHARSGYVALPDKQRLAEVSGYISRFTRAASRTRRPALPQTIVSQRFASLH